MISDPVFYLFAIPAVILVGVGKGGFSGVGLLSVPLMALVVPPIQAASIMLPILMVQDIVGVWAFRKDYSARDLKLLFPAGIVGLALGYFFVRDVPNAYIIIIVGLIATVFVIHQTTRRGVAALMGKEAALGPATLWGTATGFTSFVANAGGPPFQVYMMPRRLSPRVYAGTSTIFFAVLNYIKFPAYIHLGQMTGENLLTSAVLMPLAIASISAGVWLVRRVSADSFYRIVYALTFAVGVKLVWDGARELGLF
ncbi:MAG: sulfite exporter TauE/SafE family protein [Beijerinckiaceae bacterium]|nr:sulfite exporter TauE/SafE family protein [Beijerinckiaceae bacterium]